ncbi:PREDICTED: uncharacterized protein C19orf52 homolog [Nanorana parkeri]|uniref:uncharacterized protein C19orf52 homolog n=1 Tax=Nanorana parkeri TaxID=125878 RepID=UPI000854B312|nr:PREDICTED: uncharacterized protein C19orf52 homolog [Nanorana parkeri]
MAGRCIGVLYRRSCSSSAAPVTGEPVKQGFWERMKNRKFVAWTKSLLRDYGEACKDIVVGAKERPGKAALYISLLAGIGVCSSKAPSEDFFHSSMLEASSCLLLLSPWTRNGRSDQHVQRLIELRNEGRLRHINLTVFSLMYEGTSDPDCDLYTTQCPHLQPRWSEFPSRVLDVGFFGRWWLLQEKMKDFDINEEEFAHLPAHMRAISYDDLHSEKNEGFYLEKFKHVVMLEDTSEEDVMPEDSLKEDVMPEEALKGDVMPEEALKGDVMTQEAIKDVMPEDSLKENVMTEEALEDDLFEEDLEEDDLFEEDLEEDDLFEEDLEKDVVWVEVLEEDVVSEEALKKKMSF